MIVPASAGCRGRAHRQRLGPVEVTRREGIPVTTAERTLFDLAATEPAEALGRLCDEGCAGGSSPSAACTPSSSAPGTGRRRLAPIRAVLADRIVGYDPGANDWEQRMDRLWDRSACRRRAAVSNPRRRADVPGGSGHRGLYGLRSSGQDSTRTASAAIWTGTAIGGPF